jgi:uncharacterized protein YggT (Ycf19 family)
MTFIEIFNNLSPYFKNDITCGILRFVCVIIVNIVSYLYILVKFYKVLCYSKLTFEWLPIINPYVWPFSFFNTLTDPYFALWGKIFPTLRLQNSSLDISGIIALETLNSIVYFCVRAGYFVIELLIALEGPNSLE